MSVFVFSFLPCFFALGTRDKNENARRSGDRKKRVYYLSWSSVRVNVQLRIITHRIVMELLDKPADPVCMAAGLSPEKQYTFGYTTVVTDALMIPGTGQTSVHMLFTVNVKFQNLSALTAAIRRGKFTYKVYPRIFPNPPAYFTGFYNDISFFFSKNMFSNDF